MKKIVYYNYEIYSNNRKYPNDFIIIGSNKRKVLKRKKLIEKTLGDNLGGTIANELDGMLSFWNYYLELNEKGRDIIEVIC